MQVLEVTEAHASTAGSLVHGTGAASWRRSPSTQCSCLRASKALMATLGSSAAATCTTFMPCVYAWMYMYIAWSSISRPLWEFEAAHVCVHCLILTSEITMLVFPRHVLEVWVCVFTHADYFYKGSTVAVASDVRELFEFLRNKATCAWIFRSCMYVLVQVYAGMQERENQAALTTQVRFPGNSDHFPLIFPMIYSIVYPGQLWFIQIY